ncbi:hypothetical protein AB0E59_05895 [Lentzea sp. NPDC034063]|uniref:hypothetical protein n=1 Tax=unclassified Lentzea TaxID=2643253 RepID=UPI0033C79F45
MGTTTLPRLQPLEAAVRELRRDRTTRRIKGYVTFTNDHQVGLSDAWARYLTAPKIEGEK